jgi:hypothetical protein
MPTPKQAGPAKTWPLIVFAVLAGWMLCAFWPDLALAQNAHSQVLLDPNFRTPAPPNDAFAQNAEHVFYATLGMLTVALIMVAVSIAEGIRFKSTVPFALVMGGAACVFPESVDNYLAGCFWSQSHDPNKLFYFLMGREFDYYTIAMWWPFGALLGYIFYAALMRNVRTGALWVAFALSGVADILFEETLLRYGGIYTYFGHQPLVLLGHFPWWWLFANVAALYLSVAIAYRFRDWFNGWKSVLILALMPLCYIGGFAFSGLPTIYAMQGDFSPFVTQLAGILTCILALVQTGGIFYLILGRNPLAFGQKTHVQQSEVRQRQTHANPAVPQV